MASAFFYLSAAVAALAAFLAITRRNAAHALLYLMVSFLSLAVILYLLGAPFIAALEVIVYAGAILVLFVFVIMMLNLGPDPYGQKKAWLNMKLWVGPAILSAILLGELIWIIREVGPRTLTSQIIGPREVGVSLFGPYALSVELASMLLLAGLAGAYRLGRPQDKGSKEEE